MPTDQPDPDVTTSAPRPTAPCSGCDWTFSCFAGGGAPCHKSPDATLEAYRLAAIAEHAAITNRGSSIGAVRAAVVTLQEARDAVFAAVTTPPAIPPDLRALLEEQAAAYKAARDTAYLDQFGAGSIVRGAAEAASNRAIAAVEAVIAWTRAHAGGGR